MELYYFPRTSDLTHCKKIPGSWAGGETTFWQISLRVRAELSGWELTELGQVTGVGRWSID